VKLEEDLLALTKIELSSEYKSEEETSTGSAFSLYTLSLSIPLSLSASPIDSLPSYNNNNIMSQHNLYQIIRQQQEQLVAIQVQIQALIVGGAATEEGRVAKGSNTRPNIEVAKPPVFSREAEKVEGFITVCRLYLRMKMRGVIIEKQI